MIKFLPKVIPVLIFWAIFVYVVLQIPYPENITQADLYQLVLFFIPLYLAFSFTLNIFLKNIFISATIAIGAIFLLVLKALDSLNLVTGILTIVSVVLLISYFRKIKRRSPSINSGLKNLTKLPKIPKLTHVRK